jgi:palmitoyltransferase
VAGLLVWGYFTHLISFILFDIFLHPRTNFLWILYGIFCLVVLNIIAFLILYSYFKVVTTDPGQVPKEWKLTEDELEELESGNTGRLMRNAEKRIREALDQDLHESEDDDKDTESLVKEPDPRQSRQREVITIETKTDGNIRICHKCVARKPDRAHHCSICKRCVLKMDHHCPWVNNCVGFYNYKYFMLFLIYVVLGCTFFCVTSFSTFVRVFSVNAPQHLPTWSDINLIWIYFVSFFFGFALVFFTLYHMKLVFDNTSTIESMEKLRRFQQRHQRNPYDLGFVENFKAVFGRDWKYWFLPTMHSVEGDGIKFHIYQQPLNETPNPDEHVVEIEALENQSDTDVTHPAK